MQNGENKQVVTSNHNNDHLKKDVKKHFRSDNIDGGIMKRVRLLADSDAVLPEEPLLNISMRPHSDNGEDGHS